MFLYLGCTSDCRSIPFGYPLNFLRQVHQVPFLCFLSVQSWKSSWSTRQRVRRDHTSCCTDTLGRLFEQIHKIYLFYWCPIVKVLISGLLSSSEGLSGFPNYQRLTLILLKWRIWWAPNNASKWRMGFNWAFKGLKKFCCNFKMFNACDNQIQLDTNLNPI